MSHLAPLRGKLWQIHPTRLGRGRPRPKLSPTSTCARAASPRSRCPDCPVCGFVLTDPRALDVLRLGRGDPHRSRRSGSASSRRCGSRTDALPAVTLAPAPAPVVAVADAGARAGARARGDGRATSPCRTAGSRGRPPAGPDLVPSPCERPHRRPVPVADPSVSRTPRPLRTRTSARRASPLQPSQPPASVAPPQPCARAPRSAPPPQRAGAAADRRGLARRRRRDLLPGVRVVHVGHRRARAHHRRDHRRDDRDRLAPATSRRSPPPRRASPCSAWCCSRSTPGRCGRTTSSAPAQVEPALYYGISVLAVGVLCRVWAKLSELRSPDIAAVLALPAGLGLVVGGASSLPTGRGDRRPASSAPRPVGSAHALPAPWSSARARADAVPERVTPRGHRSGRPAWRRPSSPRSRRSTSIAVPLWSGAAIIVLGVAHAFCCGHAGEAEPLPAAAVLAAMASGTAAAVATSLGWQLALPRRPAGLHAAGRPGDRRRRPGRCSIASTPGRATSAPRGSPRPWSA